MSEKIEVENVNHPGHVTRVDAQKYRAAKTALLSVLPVQKSWFNPGGDAGRRCRRYRPTAVSWR